MKGSVFTLRGRNHLLKRLHNARVTLLCGLVTFVVLRSSLGAGKFGTPLQDYSEIRHHLHSFKLRRHQKLLLRKEVTDTAMHDDASRSTLSLPSDEGYGDGALVTDDNTLRRRAFDSNALLQWFRQRSPPHRPHILLVTSFPSCQNAIERQFLIKSLKNKMGYCRLHGIEIVYEAKGIGTPASILKELMLSHPKVEWIWWMDSLAVFTDILSPPRVESYAGHNVVQGAGGVPSGKIEALDGWEELWIGGSFLLRNSEWTRDYLERGRRMLQVGEFFVDTRMKMYEPGLGDTIAWPLVTHFGSCKLCGNNNEDLSCLTDMERAFNFANNQKMHVGSL